MKENYDKSFEYLISPACEGFREKVPDTYGEEAVWGFTRRWFPTIVSAIEERLKAGDTAGALKICSDGYYGNFWVPLGCNSLPAPLDTYAFIQGVNQGASTVRNLLRGLQDGGAEKFIELSKARYAYLIKTEPMKYARDEKGWDGRIERLVAAFPVTAL